MTKLRIFAILGSVAILLGITAVFYQVTTTALQVVTEGTAVVNKNTTRCPTGRTYCRVEVTITSAQNETPITADLTFPADQGWTETFPVWKTSTGWVTDEPSLLATMAGPLLFTVIVTGAGLALATTTAEEEGIGAGLVVALLTMLVPLFMLTVGYQP